MKLYESGEDYLEDILILEKERGFVRSADIAKRTGYARASISIAVKNLREGGYLTIDEFRHLHLTEQGQQVAEKIYERHRILTELLTRLGVPPETAERDACKIEHDLSEETFEAIKQFMTVHDAAPV